MQDTNELQNRVICITDPDQEFRETPTFGRKAGLVSPRNFLSQPSPKIFQTPTSLYNIKPPVTLLKQPPRRISLTEQPPTQAGPDNSNTLVFPTHLSKYVPFTIISSPSSITNQSSPSQGEDSGELGVHNPLHWKKQTRSFETPANNNKIFAPFFKQNLDSLLLPITSVTPSARPERVSSIRDAFKMAGTNVVLPKSKLGNQTLTRPKSKEVLPKINIVVNSPPKEAFRLKQTLSQPVLRPRSRSKPIMRLDPINPEPQEVKKSLDLEKVLKGSQEEDGLHKIFFKEEHMKTENDAEIQNPRNIYSQPNSTNLFVVGNKPASHDIKRRPKLPNVSRELPEIFRVPTKPETRKRKSEGIRVPSFSNPRILKRDTQSLSPKLLATMKPTAPANNNCFGQDWSNRIANYERGFAQL